MRLIPTAVALSWTLAIAACDRPKPAAESATPTSDTAVESVDSTLAQPVDTVAALPAESPTPSPTPTVSAATRPAPNPSPGLARPTPRPTLSSKSPTDPDGGPVSRPTEDPGAVTVTGRIMSIGSTPTNTLALVTPDGTTYRLKGAPVGLLWQRQGQTVTLAGRVDLAAPELTMDVASVRP